MLSSLDVFGGFSADVQLPPITVNMLLNLLAYEMGSRDAHDEWVTSYICLLYSLTDFPEDVKALRNAGVLDNPMGNESDEEVGKLLKAIGLDLVPNYLAYSQVKKQIQSHCGGWRNTHLSDLKHEYIKSPWSLLALLGAVMVLFLSAVQTYFTVWSPKSECDDLCKFLKMKDHL